MANSNSFLQHRQQVLGKSASTITPAYKNNSANSFQQHRQQVLIQQKSKKPSVTNTQTKKVSTTPVQVSRAQSLKTKSQELFNKAFSLFVDKKTGQSRISQQILEGVKTIKPNLEIGGGVTAKYVTQQRDKNKEEYRKIYERQKKSNPEKFKNTSFDDWYKKSPLSGERVVSTQDLKKKGDALIAKGASGTQKAQQERIAKLGKREGVGGFIDDLAYSTPSTVASLGLGFVTGFVTKRPEIGVRVGLATTFTQGVSEVYQSAKEQGMGDKEAEKVAVVGGFAYSLLNKMPISRLLEKSPSGDLIKRTFLQKTSQILTSTGKQSFLEGVAEGGEQVVSNILSQIYTENPDYFKGIPESVLAGAIMGSGADVTFNAAGGISNQVKRALDGELKNAEEIVQGAINTAPEERTPEQQEIIETLLEKRSSPQEVLAYVVDTPLAKTAEGKELVKIALQAQSEGKQVYISGSEDGEIEVSIADDVIGKAEDIPEAQVEEKGENSESRSIDIPSTLKDEEKPYYEYLANNTEELMNQYESANTKDATLTLNVDNAKELFRDQGYGELNVVDANQAGGRLIGEVFDRAIQSRKGQGNNKLYETLGGPGSGKTTTTQQIQKDGQTDYPIIVDAIGANYKFVKKQIDTALDNGYNIDILYVYRDPIDAWENGVLNRDRHVPVENFIAGHKGSRDSFLKVIDDYKDNEKVFIEAYENKTGADAKPISIEYIEKIEYNDEQIKQKIAEVTKAHYEAKDRKGLTKSKYDKIQSELQGKSSVQSSKQDISGESKKSDESKDKSGIAPRTPSQIQEELDLLQNNAEYAQSIRDMFTERQIRDINSLKTVARSKAFQEGDIETIRNSDNRPLLERVLNHVRESSPHITADTDALDFALSIPTKSETIAPKYKKPDPVVKGDTPSKIAKSIERKAIEDKLTVGFEGLAGYDKITVKEQAEMATDLLKDIEKTRRVIRGEESLPKGLRGTALIIAVEEYIKKTGDADVAFEMANSPLVSETSAAAQELRLAAEREPDSIAVKIREIRESREKSLKRKTGKSVNEVKDRVKEDIKKSVKAVDKYDWNNFISSLEC